MGKSGTPSYAELKVRKMAMKKKPLTRVLDS
jgi:hypothetical protein